MSLELGEKVAPVFFSKFFSLLPGSPKCHIVGDRGAAVRRSTPDLNIEGPIPALPLSK